MSVRTGVSLTDFSQLGGMAAAASSDDDRVNIALDVAWDWVEDLLDTHIIQSQETDEEHPFPSGLIDWDRPGDRITLVKSHLVSVTSIKVIDETHYCSCETYENDACALIVNALPSIIAVRDCFSSARSNCGSCQGGGYRNFKVLVSYLAGIFSSPPLHAKMKLAVVMKAREVLHQISEPGLEGLGSRDITTWSSMDYSETRSPPGDHDSYIDGYLRGTLLRDYFVKTAFALRGKS